MSTPPTPSTQPAPSSKPANEGGEEKSRYRATLNLPKTSFPMKANLVQNEPASIKRWQGMKLYERVRETSKGKPRYVFHDGPPYANGSIHLGHLLNKSLKDFVVRSRTMMGMDCPYVPGWDCHGLPIEHKVMLELLEAGKLDKLKSLSEDQRRMAVRRECQKYAEKYVKLHIEQMTRALTLADYEHPYLTMQPSFEGATLEVLASLMEQGLVYRSSTKIATTSRYMSISRRRMRRRCTTRSACRRTPMMRMKKKTKALAVILKRSLGRPSPACVPMSVPRS
jgi:isoleucyl-tRNA synthetase